MTIKPYNLLLLFLFLVLAGFPGTGLAATTTDVTFTVPVQVNNIHADWQKVAVMCRGFISSQTGAGGANHPEQAAEVGEIDVTGKAGGTVDQTVTGTIPVNSAADRWECFLFIQHQGDRQPVYPRNTSELKTTNGTIASGAF